MLSNPIILKDVADVGLANWDAVPFLQKVTDIVPSIIYIFNQATQSNEYSNRSLGASLGYSSEEIRAMGAGMLPQLCHRDDWPRIEEHFRKIMTLQDGEVLQIEYRLRHKAGNWVWLLSHDTVFDRDAQGEVLRHIGVAKNITLQKHAQEAARAAHLKATLSNDELRAFSYSLSHDMKAPANTLHLILTELMEAHEAALDPDATGLVGMALATVERMGRLIDDVLHYSLTIHQDCTMQPVVLTTVLEDILDDLAAMTQQHGARITLSDLPVVEADPTQIRILFQNLIENAIKFRKRDDPPAISICAHPTTDDTRCRISVADNGIGIAPEKHQHVFTIFKRLSPTPDAEGSGLGLAICRRIAANHGSSILVRSSPGHGARFSVDLTLAQSG